MANTTANTNEKKYLSYDGLTNYDTLIKGVIDTAIDTHNHDGEYDAKGSAKAVQDNLDTVSDTLNGHTSNENIHLTSAEKTKLAELKDVEAGAQVNTITGVKGNSESAYRTGNVNITKANIGLGNVDNTSDANKPISNAQQIAFDEVNNTINTHKNNDNIHVTTGNKTNWNAAYTHSTSTHARTDATKVEDSATNGNIKINGTETNVYTHPDSGVSAGTYKSVTVDAEGHVVGGSNPTTLEGYGITDAEKKNTVSIHNTAADAHSDIRLLITNLTTKLNNFLDVDVGTTNQLSDLLTLINENATDIETITSGKVNVTDIINNLTTNVTNKPLSAAQGVALKNLIDTLDLALNTHDANTTKHITPTERTNWNAAKSHADSAHAPSDAQKNQNAFSNVKVGSTTIAADTTTDTLELVGSNVTITPDATNDKVTISVADASTSAKGIVQLTNSTSSTSTTTAATPNSVKSAYDLANTAKGATDDIYTKLDEVKSSYLPLAGGTVTGTTVFNKVQDAVANAYNEPAVVIGGNPEQAHLELDNNEIQAKGSKTTAGNLFLNSNGGTVHVGFGGLKVDSEGVIIPEDALSSSVGTAALPFNRMFGRYFELYGAADTQYGRFRVGTTGTTSTAGVTALELGNNKATGTLNNASGKVTMYGSGTGFTNILPNTNTSGSNSVYLPTGSGTLALVETSTKMMPMTTAEYNALTTEEIDANTLYMITDAKEEVIPTIQFITWGEKD